MNGPCLGPIAVRWPIGCALLLFAVAGQAFGSATLSGTVTPAANGDISNAVVVATSDTYKVYRVPVDAGAGGRVAPGEGEGIHASDGSPALSLRRVEIPTEKRATPEATPSISRRLAGSSDL